MFCPEFARIKVIEVPIPVPVPIYPIQPFTIPQITPAI